MIAKGKSISHLSAAIKYALREEGIVLDSNIGAETPHGVVKEFEMYELGI